MNYKDITQHEIEALNHEYNVSDAHTHQSQSPTQLEIIKRLPQLWLDSENRKYGDLEQEFVTKFFEFRQQPVALRNNTCLLAYSASVSTAIVSNYFARKKQSIAVIEPCFDNLVDLLRLSGNQIHSLPEDIIFKSDDIYGALQATVTADVIYITDPNNPTCNSLMIRGRAYWQELIRYCVEHNKVLMLDLCFSPFLYVSDQYKPFDLYELLEDSGVSYITLEDTGKSFPIQDMKASILKCSTDIYDELRNISTIYLLQVSPFALRVLIEYLQDAISTNFAHTKNLIQTNWQTARRYLALSCLELQEPDIPGPVIWCRLPNNVDGAELKEFLVHNNNVHVVPGQYFTWSRPEENKNFIRLALARNTDVFEKSMQALRNGLTIYEQHYIKN